MIQNQNNTFSTCINNSIISKRSQVIRFSYRYRHCDCYCWTVILYITMTIIVLSSQCGISNGLIITTSKSQRTRIIAKTTTTMNQRYLTMMMNTPPTKSIWNDPFHNSKNNNNIISNKPFSRTITRTRATTTSTTFTRLNLSSMQDMNEESSNDDNNKVKKEDNSDSNSSSASTLLTRNLLGTVLRRAQTTLSEKNNHYDYTNQSNLDSKEEQEEENNNNSNNKVGLDGTDAVALIQSAIQRAESTLATNNNNDSKNNNTSNNERKSYSTASATSTSTTADGNNNNKKEETMTENFKQQQQQLTETTKSTTATNTKLPKQSQRYKANPAITNTALAQTLWSTILRPNIDSAIDATCGNGYDSVILAKMLFGINNENDNNDNDNDDVSSDSAGIPLDSQSQLLCLDIQQTACDNTLKALTREFGTELMNHSNSYIQVLQTSHAPLPRPNDSSSVGLVVYNLGYLPNRNSSNTNTKTKNERGETNVTVVTKLETTLYSIVDAMLMIRIGGMISVVTYPKTNPEEDLGVRILLECAALLTSNLTTWKEFLNDALGGHDDGDGNDNKQQQLIHDLVQSSMERIVAQGDPKQTWRVSEHKKLGMDRAPILITATRIK